MDTKSQEDVILYLSLFLFSFVDDSQIFMYNIVHVHRVKKITIYL